MRPDVAVPERYGFLDLLAEAPRSVFDFPVVSRKLATAAISWRTIVCVLGASVALSSTDVSLRELVKPQLEEAGGVFGLLATALVMLPAIYGLLFALQKFSLRIFGVRTTWRRIAIGFVASELPQAVIAIAMLAVFTVAQGIGADVRDGSAYSIVESSIAFGLWGYFLTFAISETAEISMGKAAAAVLLGPGWLMALFFWFAVSPG